MNKQRIIRFTEQPDALTMGTVAAEQAADLLGTVTKTHGKEALVVFAAAPSQDTFLDALCDRADRIDWNKVVAFHLDEYLTLPSDHPNTFKAYLQEHIFDRVPIPKANVHFIKDAPTGTENVASWYSAAFTSELRRIRRAGGLYLAFLGIGVNGHVAFNEPNTSLDSAFPFLQIELDDVSVQQQYDDYKNHPNPSARYASLDAVPRQALTISVSAILEADRLFVMVPGSHKAQAVKGMIDGPITEDLPASYLRLHHDTTVYVDAAAAELVRTRPASALAQ